MIPSLRLLIGLLALVVCSATFGGLWFVAQGLAWEQWSALAKGLAGSLLSLFLALLLFISLDALFSWRYLRRQLPSIQVQRTLPSALGLEHWYAVELEIKHGFNHRQGLCWFDQPPWQCRKNQAGQRQPWQPVESRQWCAEIDGKVAKPQRLTLLPGHRHRLSYAVRFCQRGDYRFTGVQLLCDSRLGFWQFKHELPLVTDIRVLPDFNFLNPFLLLGLATQQHLLGIKHLPRRGAGLEFHQLREYCQDDNPRQIDWKASMRQTHLVAREYQQERDQRVLLLLDCGRRMATTDAGLDFFDQALNATVLLAHNALQQGDSVGFMSLAAEQRRWLLPQKGTQVLSRLMHMTYDLQASEQPTDYLQLLHEVPKLSPKRALVILLTCSQPENLIELEQVSRRFRGKHLLLVANLRETAVDQSLTAPVHDQEAAYRLLGAVQFNQQRQRMLSLLQKKPVYWLDCQADQLPLALLNRYHQLKRQGQL